MQYEVDLRESSIKGVQFKEITISPLEAELIQFGWLFEQDRIEGERRILTGLSRAAFVLNPSLGMLVNKKIVRPLHDRANQQLPFTTRAGFDLVGDLGAVLSPVGEFRKARNDHIGEGEVPETLTLKGSDVELALQGLAYYVRHVAAERLFSYDGTVDGPYALELAAALNPLAAVEKERRRIIHEVREPRLGDTAELAN